MQVVLAKAVGGRLDSIQGCQSGLESTPGHANHPKQVFGKCEGSKKRDLVWKGARRHRATGPKKVANSFNGTRLRD